MRSRLPFINVYKKESLKSEIVTQILYGETFKKIGKKGSWYKIINDSDRYKGFIKKIIFPQIKKIPIKFLNCMQIYIQIQI